MENIPSANVARNVRRLRQERGWSLARLSEEVSVFRHPLSINVLSKIELGDRGIDVDDLVALTGALGVSSDTLLGDPADEEIRELVEVRNDLRNRRIAAQRTADRANTALAQAEAELAGVELSITEAITEARGRVFVPGVETAD